MRLFEKNDSDGDSLYYIPSEFGNGMIGIKDCDSGELLCIKLDIDMINHIRKILDYDEMRLIEKDALKNMEEDD